MDAIQSYRGAHAPASASAPVAAAHARFVNPTPVVNPAAVKGTSDYLRALRRRYWMVLAVAVPLAVLGCTLVLRMKPVYQVKVEIEINAPDYDPALSALVSRDISHRSAGSQEKYIPNRAAQLKTERLQQKVVGSPDLAADMSQFDNPLELFGSLKVVALERNSNTFLVSLEGNDPYRTKRLMEVLLDQFYLEAKNESASRIEASRGLAKENLAKLRQEQDQLDDQIKSVLEQSTTLGAGGKSLIEERVVSLGDLLRQKQMRLGQLNQQLMLMQYFPQMDHSPGSSRQQAQLDRLDAQRQRYTEYLEMTTRAARNPNSDLAAQHASRKLTAIMDEMDRLKNLRTEVGMTPMEMILEQYQREIDADKEEHARLLREMRASLPEHQRVLDKIEARKEKARRIAEMTARLAEFEILSDSPGVSEFVKVPSSVPEPAVPVKPNKPLLIVASLIMSLAAGIGLVCLLEHIDHAVKVPEHVSHGLTLPLLGVVPRIRRNALTQRGSHLWTPGSSDALACDAYRNVRAGLLGVADRHGPIVTLLVTSAKAGEGKSTTALNLAATCALAGERTLLLDVDLRRPSLADVFNDDEDHGSTLGLVDVLKGEAPWQRTLQHTRIPNLDFMSTGDTRDTPIEILGTLELRQLMTALSHHYDRVILDGPAVLGLADCRFLGRMVDASLLVVRSGAHHLTTLQRVKTVLEQSHIAIAGVVFNGLTDDMENWSSYYGYGSTVPLPGRGGAGREALALS